MHELRLRADDLTWRDIDGEVVAVDIASSVYLSANPAGALLWSMLAAGTSRDELATKLVETFGIDRERADADVDTFVQTLEARNLLDG